MLQLLVNCNNVHDTLGAYFNRTVDRSCTIVMETGKCEILCEIWFFELHGKQLEMVAIDAFDGAIISSMAIFI